jgi:hypothetical protein
MLNSERDGEIVGLASGSNGRSCEVHECCGAAIRVGDLVRFRLTMLEIEGGEPVEALKVLKITDGTEGCHVGFLPRHFVTGARRSQMINAFGQIIVLYKDTTIEVLRRKNARLHGVASFRLLTDIQITE